MRGGTSKGVFFRAEDLPRDPVERERVLMRTIGSPDGSPEQLAAFWKKEVEKYRKLIAEARIEA